MTKRKDGRYVESIISSGKRIYFYGKTKSEALKKLAEYKEKSENKQVLFADVVHEWQEEHYANIRPKTQAEYKAMCNRLIDYFGDRVIKHITPKDIEVFISDVARKGYAKQTVSTNLLVANMIFRYAIVQGYIETSPAEYIRIPKNLPKKKRELPTDEEIQKIKDSVDLHFGLFPFFILYTGLRKGEALALCYEDINFEKKTVSVNKVLEFRSNKPILRSFTKSAAGMRTVVLPDILISKLPNKKHGAIFTFDGEYMTAQGYKRHYEHYMRVSGVNCTAHQIRHAYATILYEAGISDMDTQAMMGHASITTTRQIYQHIREARLDEARTQINSFLSSGVKNDVKSL